MEILEILAIIFALIYIWLLARQDIRCWYPAFFSALIYAWLLSAVHLHMAAGLNMFYAAMSVFGWYQWKHGGRDKQGVEQRHLSLKTHAFILLLLIVAVAVFGEWVDNDWDDPDPYLDSIVTCASFITTFLVIWKVVENWLYWIVIYAISVYLYLDRELYLTALLFAVYMLIAIKGYMNWRSPGLIVSTADVADSRR